MEVRQRERTLGAAMIGESGSHTLTAPVTAEPIGRDRERRLLDAVLYAVTRRSTTLALWGDPGIGKTVLLDYVADRAGMPVLRARGAEQEALLPYAALADLMVPLQRHFGAIPRVQRDALESCLAISDAVNPNPYAVCAAALSVLAAAAETAPVVLLVDDLHWIDPSSRRVLLFVARRLTSERVAMVLTSRDDDDLRGRCDVPAVDVTGLPPAACAQLLQRHGFTPVAGVLADLVDRTGGNPLALIESAASLRAAQLAGQEPIGHALPLGRQLESTWLPRLQQLPDRTRAALAVLDAGRSPATGDLEPALAVLGLTLTDLAPAEAAGVVVPSGAGYEFRHPLLRSAVRRQTLLPDRLAAYEALARTTTGTARAWYRASATTAPDEGAAAEMAAVAVEARRRSAYDAAAHAWHRAAELTPPSAARGALLCNAATDALLGGMLTRAAAWCDEALTAVTEPAARAGVERLRGRIRTWLGRPAAAHDGLIAAAEAIREQDPAQACLLLSEAALPAAMDGDVPLSVRCGQRGVSLAESTGIRSPHSAIAYGQALIVEGRIAEGLASLDRAADFLAAADPVADQHLLAVVGQSLGHAERHGPARRMVTMVVDAARRHAAPAVLPIALSARSEFECWAGRWAAAEADATESLRWAEELGQPGVLGYALACLARIEALRGNPARCEDHITRARQDVGPYSVACLDVYFTAVLGLSALSLGEYETAMTQLRQTFDLATRQGVGNPRIVPFAADLIEASIRAGHPGEAEQPIGWLERAAERSGQSWAAAVLARSRGMLAPTAGKAERWFDEADRLHSAQDYPFERARTLLCRGEAFRRFRRPSAARPPLSAAHAGFQSLGATAWARRSAAELAAAGQPTAVAVISLDALTPQEVQVARSVARGMNNAEAAGALFLSRKTVEAHLTHIYRKLGVRSRTDLTRALVSAGLAE
ncbi:transcriptional regulator [Actinoplanes lobatus]|uniref:Transcriptional regulator n=1 Tax=Actinoplanes lobatus TaxID=113568 RepID=A0A7W7HMA2_9ACTN|nr:LuxR family transcriptional regulator [Actinoplanes lobatus]MBB4753133.1 DNA-binding CsgD family transcriptional regulator [Actinoplanes lobatus]GGN58823.1 transcriptional regulator [Actinoplanes lobatus]GIE43007.1 transcriptional regulator [Actinoplanes lobatus]